MTAGPPKGVTAVEDDVGWLTFEVVQGSAIAVVLLVGPASADVAGSESQVGGRGLSQADGPVQRAARLDDSVDGEGLLGSGRVGSQGYVMPQAVIDGGI